jgi:hypothetical protein
LLEFHHEFGIGLFSRHNGLLKLLISLLESLNLLSLAFTRRLGSAAVSENTLNAALFLFVLSLSSLSV